MLCAKEIKGLYAILPTPARENGARLDGVDTVDLAETERVVNRLIADGADGIIALGTTGECATLSGEDYEKFVGTLLEVVGKRVPTFVGASALGGHEVAKRMRFIERCGADGTLMGLPMWQPMTVDAAVNFYHDLSESFPRTAVMVYANERAFRFPFPDAFWSAVVDVAPTVVAAKYSRPKDLRHLLDITKGRVNVVPNEMTLPSFYKDAPDTTTACWATAASMGPAPVIALMNAVFARDGAEMDSLSAAIAWANEPVAPIISNRELFAFYNIQVEKLRINAAGYCKAGPVRPPYADVPEDIRAASVECGQRWAALCGRLAEGKRELLLP